LGLQQGKIGGPEFAGRGETGVVHQYVDTGGQSLRDLPAVSRLGQVGGQHSDGTPALAAQFDCQPAQPISIARHQHQVVPVRGIATREAFADPGCGPGDQGDAAWHGVSVLSAMSRPRRVGRRGKRCRWKPVWQL
jgi:hypothetical protein